jgi:hypothetical protein
MTTISTTGMAQLSTDAKTFKTNIEAAIDGAVGNNALTSAHIFVGNASNVAADVAVTGTLVMANDGSTSLSLADGKIFAGNASNVAAAVTPSGLVGVANTGVVSWSTNWANVATTSAAGELTIANMTSNGGIIVLPRATVGTNGPITHQTAAAGKVTLFYDGSTNVAASLSVAYIVAKI